MIIKQAYIGILDTASDSEGNMYDDWRYAYIGKLGVIAICEADSVDQAGNSRICFFPPEPLGSYLKTSYGDIQKTADTLSIVTRNSQYSFGIDNDCLSDGLKEIWKKNMQRVFPEILDQIEKIL
ncbi:hypothetical protein [Eubacterium ramulus]